MSQLDIANAKKALAHRLRTWGTPGNPAKLADGFIEDLVAMGWAMDARREMRPAPPKAADECPAHPGQPRGNCGGCASDAAAYDGAPRPTPAWEPGDAKAGAAAARAALRGGTDG